ncbi:MAG: hypothetical protein JWM50_1545 [Microbacteriaceae bacterium]|jgi:uncharacterized Tic20 family protein|nr:hypothetical protein [Microbacteriaceae bacterium]
MTDEPVSRDRVRSAGDERLWACFSHFGGLLGIAPPLVIFLVLKDRSSLVRREAKEALNWQITFIMGYLVLLVLAGLLSLVLAVLSFGNAAPVLTALPFLLYIANALFSVMGGLRVSSGGTYRYPFSIRLVR